MRSTKSSPEQQTVRIREFQFQTGDTLDALTIHYATLGTPKHDSEGFIANAILLIHGTAGNWRTYMQSWWADNMYGPGQPLDLSEYFVIISDNLGAGQSSKPSDGMGMGFPRYSHADVVRAQFRLLSEHLSIRRLKAVIGSSYGGRLAWQWAIQHPSMVQGIIPIIASPFPVAGRRGMQDFLATEPLRLDPTWQDGEYQTQPKLFPLALMNYWVFIDGAEHLWSQAPTRQEAWAYLPKLVEKLAASIDANDWIYQLDANRDFDAISHLDVVRAKLFCIELGGDEMVPIELRHIDAVRQALGGQVEYLLVPDAAGYGHSGLPITIDVYGPRIRQFLEGLPSL